MGGAQLAGVGLVWPGAGCNGHVAQHIGQGALAADFIVPHPDAPLSLPPMHTHRGLAFPSLPCLPACLPACLRGATRRLCPRRLGASARVCPHGPLHAATADQAAQAQGQPREGGGGKGQAHPKREWQHSTASFCTLSVNPHLPETLNPSPAQLSNCSTGSKIYYHMMVYYHNASSTSSSSSFRDR